MSTHPYSCKSPEAVWSSNGRIASGAYLGYREIRKSMLARGDDKPIWFTEFGWSTSTQECGVSEATQADYLTKAFKLAAQDSYVQVAFWYNFRNNYWMHDADDVESRYGLLRSDFSHKPSYDAFKACASGSCGSAAATSPAGSRSRRRHPQDLSQGQAARAKGRRQELAPLGVEAWRSGRIVVGRGHGRHARVA